MAAPQTAPHLPGCKHRVGWKAFQIEPLFLLRLPWTNVMYDGGKRCRCFDSVWALAAGSPGRCAPRQARLCSLGPVSCANRDKATVFDRSAPGRRDLGGVEGRLQPELFFFFVFFFKLQASEKVWNIYCCIFSEVWTERP